MPFVPTPHGIKACLRMGKAGQQVCNIFHIDAGATVTSAMLETIGGIIVDWWASTYGGLHSNDVVLSAVELTDISETGGIGVEYTTGLPLTGGAGENPLPNNVTVATKLLTGRTGRSYRGRSYFAGVPGNVLTTDQQHITDAFAGQLSSAWQTLATNLFAEGFKLAILSLIANKVPRAAGVLTAVTGAVTNTVLDSQRRRLPERGS